MFVGTINEPNDKTSFLFLNDEKKISGFTYFDGKIQSVDKDTMKVFSCFKLGENRKSLGIEDGYQVILDLDTDFKHYFKDDKEDIKKLYFCNGEDAAMFSSKNEDNKEKSANMARKFKTIFGELLSLSFDSFKMLILGFLLTRTAMFVLASESAKMQYIDDFVSKYGSPFDIEISVQDIKNSIYSSPNLDLAERGFIYNEELLMDVLSYYKDSSLTFLSRVRHDNMDIVSYTKKEKDKYESKGYFAGGNLLHVRDYETSSQLQDGQTADTVGHEYAHMLQANHDLSFISEAVADIISHEYYLNSCDQSYTFSYDIGVRYTEVLMEIVGPEVIWDRVFRKGSNSLENAVRPYLNDVEFSIFFGALKKPSSELEHEEIWNLLYIANKLYSAKYGSEMGNNELIQAIINGQDCCRTYFRKSLVEEKPSYYTVTSQEVLDYQNIEKMCDNNELECSAYYDLYSLEEWQAYQNENLIKKDLCIFNSTGMQLSSEGISYADGVLTGQIKVYNEEKNEEYMCDIMDAINDGKVTISYRVWCKVSLREFRANVHNQRYNIEFVDKENDYEYWFNREDFTLTCRRNEKVYVDEIVGQNFSSTKNTVFGS